MDLVEVRHSTRSVHHIAKQSTPQEWATMASSFFEKGKYELAMHAYERASLRREHAVARAYYLKEQAMICPLTIDRHGITRTEAFTAAAETFMEIAHAAAAFKERVTYFTNAAHCFASTGDDTNTARAYYGAAQYTYAAQHYRKAGLFIDALDVVKSHRELIDPNVAESIQNVCRIIYLRKYQWEYVSSIVTSVEPPGLTKC